MTVTLSPGVHALENLPQRDVSVAARCRVSARTTIVISQCFGITFLVCVQYIVSVLTVAYTWLILICKVHICCAFGHLHFSGEPKQIFIDFCNVGKK